MAQRNKVLDFWAAHSLARGAIGAVYGPNWAIKAPVGETVLLRLAPRMCALVTERGTRLRWRRDWRMPGARFWPGGRIPCEHERACDHARSSGSIAVAVLRARLRARLGAFERETAALQDRLAEAEMREGTAT